MGAILFNGCINNLDDGIKYTLRKSGDTKVGSMAVILRELETSQSREEKAQEASSQCS